MQSGSAGVLARMRRRYTPEEYMRSVERLRKYLPGCAITTDVLTGFPGETEEEAQETLDFVRAVGFARIHVFPYSRRKGTVAGRHADQVPEAVKHARAAKLLALGNQLEENFVSHWWGQYRTCCLRPPPAKRKRRATPASTCACGPKPGRVSSAGCAYARGKERSRAGKFSIDGR